MPLSYRAAQALIKRGDEAALLTALGNQLDPNLTNENGWSLLMISAVEGSVPLGKLLLERGADPTKTNSNSQTALDIAIARHHIGFVDLLSPKPDQVQAATDLD